ncbi:MAG: hypothetical protein DI535_03855 [Citrobacter freundii]|nr:MAG: hypothetical protein DI535_03855 [Citrobacter freundii]
MDAATLSASSDQLIEQLLSAKLNEDEIVIGISWQNGITTAVLTWDEYNNEQILSLRYYKEGYFDLYYSYYDDGRGSYVSLVHDLNKDQISSLPEGLAAVMAQALVADQPIIISKNQLNSSQSQ